MGTRAPHDPSDVLVVIALGLGVCHGYNSRDQGRQRIVTGKNGARVPRGRYRR